MNSTHRILLAATAPVAALGFAAAANAQAFYLQEQSTRAQGRAFSGEAADTGVDSIWWNPAAIGGMQGGEGSLHAAGILPRGTVADQGTLIARPGQPPAPVGGGASQTNPIRNGVLPSGAIAYGFGGVALGLAVTAPYNFTTQYDANSWTRYTADRTKLRTIDIQPTIAFSPAPGFSVGAGLNVEYADATLSNYLPNLLAFLPDGHQELSGDGWNVGWSVGAQARSGPFSIGLSYKSAIKHKLNGTVTTTGLLGPLAGQNGSIPTTATFRTPWQAIGSVRFKATPQLTLNAQVVAYGWSRFDAITLGAPLNVAIPENYRDSWSYAGGVDYAVDPRLTLRAGVQYGETPTSNGNRDSRVPDSNRWNFSGGASYALSKAFTVDAAVSYIRFKDAPINRISAAYAGTPAQTPILVNGALQNASALVLGLGGRIAF